MKRVFRYFHGTGDYGLSYQGRLILDKFLDIHGFGDTYWIGDMDLRISTSGYVFSVFGDVVCWME